MTTSRDFYDDLAGDYHLLFPDWPAAVARQGRVLDDLIRGELGPGDREVLDCACGIGTQALGLATLGHRVTASDLSPVAARRAAVEASARDITVRTVAADMRHLPFHGGSFDVVVCADNAIAHLMTPTGLGAALREIRRVLRPRGLLLVGTRSDVARATHPAGSPPQVSPTDDGPVISFQLWDWHDDGQHYDLRHIQLTPSGDTFAVRVRRTTSWALTRAEVIESARDAGYDPVDWYPPERTGFGQPLLVARTAGRDAPSGIVGGRP